MFTHIYAKPVFLEDFVWIGSNFQNLKKAYIGEKRSVGIISECTFY